MAKPDAELVQDCLNRFIDLANTIKDEGTDINVVASGLMAASGLYATYAMGGNEGTLNPAGLDKLTDTFRDQLVRIQRGKKQSAKG